MKKHFNETDIKVGFSYGFKSPITEVFHTRIVTELFKVRVRFKGPDQYDVKARMYDTVTCEYADAFVHMIVFDMNLPNGLIYLGG